MKDFFWTSGHLGWGLFSLLVFSGLWVLAFDLVWRSVDSTFFRLAVIMLLVWLIGSTLLVLGFVSWF